MSFEIIQSSSRSRARAGFLDTNHGKLETPFFMTIATRGVVKTIDTVDLENLNAPIILGNTYHLMLRPGIELVTEMGGLHQFMNWQRPILTDSGGYQVFSLAKRRELTEDGVKFHSTIDGAEHMLSPERSMEVQHALGSDIVMAFDECTEYPATEERARDSMELTGRWAARSKEHYKKIGGRGLLFGIVQGSTFETLREQSARDLIKIGFDGYAIGGLSIDEPREETYRLVSKLDQILPTAQPRYFMGAGQPQEIVEYVRRGIDMFDCVLPTRNARHGLLYRFTEKARENFAQALSEGDGWYETVHITNEQYKLDQSPLDAKCICPFCTRHSRAYLRYLFSIGEPLAQRLATLHNVSFYLELMRLIRVVIRAGKL